MRCALLVITIHTNPFERINITINFLLVNIISTIAVPFFFLLQLDISFMKNIVEIKIMKLNI